ncbi:MAG: sensor histidine kinase, partial [Acidimicrobiales bacterium]|nr:sensor histidine kinase [Acidimicrobiales bacterium]
LSSVVVSDNGNGMTKSECERGFLTIASRRKAEATRFSPIFSRRYTGAKGIGRLAAHKLAHSLVIESFPNPDVHHSGDQSAGVSATLDWDMIESYTHLDEIIDALPVTATNSPGTTIKSAHGTTITLSRLRRAWTDRDLSNFVSEVQGYEPPPDVYGPHHPELYSSPLLGSGVKVRGDRAKSNSKQTREPAPFKIHLEGDFDRGEDLAPQPGAAAQYVLEIDSNQRSLTYGIARTAATERSLPQDLHTPILPVRLPPLENGPYFEARIFIRSGDKSSWPRSATGVRVYMEGFRVLPYGEPGNDWLGTDSQYTQRGRELVSFGEKYSTDALFGSKIADEGLSMLPANGYIGGVFLTEDSSGGLQMLVNREGFLPGQPLETLTATVRRGIDYVTRIRARDKAAKRRTGTRSSRTVVTRTRTQALAERTANLTQLVRSVNDAITAGETAKVQTSVRELAALTEEVASVTDDLLDELNMIRVLASVGSQLSAFVHELNGLLAVTTATQRQLRLARSKMKPSESRATARVSASLEELKRGLDRQASYLVDVTSADARRRRSAQRVRDRVDAVFRMLSVTAQRRHVILELQVPETVRTRPMFRAELTAILTNLLTNAVKAATPEDALTAHQKGGALNDDDYADHAGSIEEPSQDGADHHWHHTSTPDVGTADWGTVRVEANEDGDGTTLVISNTGVGVDVAESERWFDPYASTTTETDPVLGQGTGLGLTITRSLVAENAGTVEFVQPPPGFATCIRVHFPSRRPR